MPAEGTGMVARLWEREAGRLPPRRFAHAVRASEEMVHSLGIQKRLRKHRSCVNTISFNSNGNLLMSTSEDKTVALWNLEEAAPRLIFDAGHREDALHAQFMPLSDDRSIVTCGAYGEVRHSRIQEGGHVLTDTLADLGHMVPELAVELGSPHTFFSCVEDGSVWHFDLRRKYPTKLFKLSAVRTSDCLSCRSCRTLKLNGIAVDPRNPSCFAVCGTDEYVRLYDTRKFSLESSKKFGPSVEQFCPQHLVSNHDKRNGISGLAFSHTGELLLASYRYENIYLFSREHGLCFNSFDEICSEKLPPVPRAFKGHQNMQPIKGVTFIGPNCEYVASGSDCGHVFIWRKKDGELVRAMKGDMRGVICVEQHPTGIVIASTGLETDIKIWAPGDCGDPSTAYVYDAATNPFLGTDNGSDGSFYMDDDDMFSSGAYSSNEDDDVDDDIDNEQEANGDEDQKDDARTNPYLNRRMGSDPDGSFYMDGDIDMFSTSVDSSNEDDADDDDDNEEDGDDDLDYMNDD